MIVSYLLVIRRGCHIYKRASEKHFASLVLFQCETAIVPLMMMMMVKCMLTGDRGLSRVAPKEGVTIGTRTFSEGTILSINPWVLHYSKECWGSDATEFNPDRWVAEDIGARERYLIPFGAGYASCPGQHLARIELSKMAATIVRDYDICQVNAGQEWQYVANFTAVPHSWPVYIQKYFRTA